MRLYYLLGQALRPFAMLIFSVYNVFTHQPRAQVIVRSRNRREVLLIRNWTGTRAWQLPGGGIGRNETAWEAGQRELTEELGISLPSGKFRFVATIPTPAYTVSVYAATIDKRELPPTPHNPWEITHQQWFALGDLPEVSPVTAKALGFLGD